MKKQKNTWSTAVSSSLPALSVTLIILCELKTEDTDIYLHFRHCLNGLFEILYSSDFLRYFLIMEVRQKIYILYRRNWNGK